MTFFSGTVGEVIYNMPSAGAALANSTTKSVITANSSSNPPFQVPAPLWQPSYASARLVRVVAGGTWGNTTVATTLTIGAYLDPTQNSTTSQVLLAGSGALPTTTTAVTNGNWLLDFYITVSSMGVGSGAFQQNVYTNGVLTLGAGNNATTTFANAVGGTAMVGSSAATIQVNPMATYFLELWATWGAANAANTIQCTQFTVFGLN